MIECLLCALCGWVCSHHYQPDPDLRLCGPSWVATAANCVNSVPECVLQKLQQKDVRRILGKPDMPFSPPGWQFDYYSPLGVAIVYDLDGRMYGVCIMVKPSSWVDHGTGKKRAEPSR